MVLPELCSSSTFLCPVHSQNIMKAVFEEMYSGSVRQTGLEKKALRQEAAEIQVANATMLRTTCEVAGG